MFSFRRLLLLAGGPHVSRAFDAMYAVSAWSVLVVFVRISAEQMHLLMQGIGAPGVLQLELLWLGVASAVYGVASAKRHMTELRVTSWTGFLIMLYIIGMMVVRFFQGGYSQTGSIVAADVNYDKKVNLQIFKALATLSGAFGCQYSIPLLFNELVDGPDRQKHMKCVVSATLFGVLLLYVLTGCVGLLMFGDALIVEKKGDVLSCFRSGDVAVDVARGALFFHFVGSYPVYAVSGRKAINFLFADSEDSLPTRILLAEVFALVTSSSVAAYFIPGIGVGFGLNCALFGSVIVSIAPCFAYLRLVPVKERDNGTTRCGWLLVKKFFAYVSLGIGCLVTVLGVYEWSEDL